MKFFLCLVSLNLFINYFAWADFNNTLPEHFNPQPDTQQSSQTTEKSSQIVPNKKPSPPKNKPSPSQTNLTQPNPNKEEQNVKSKTPSSPTANELSHNSDAPVNFKSDYAEGSRINGTLNLIGNVVLIQDDTTLTSNKAQLLSSTNTTILSGSRTIQKAIATGNVHILKTASLNSPEIRASGDEITFFIPEKIVVLKGNAKVWKGNEFLDASVIEMNLETGETKIKHPKGVIEPKNNYYESTKLK